MTKLKKRKANDKISEAITPDSPISKKPYGHNLPIQRSVTQSDKSYSPVVSTFASYQIFLAIRFRDSHDTLMVAPTLPLMSTQACLTPKIEKDIYVAALSASTIVELTRASLDDIWPMYGDNNIKTVSA